MRSEQLDQTPPTDLDFDTVGSDVDPAGYYFSEEARFRNIAIGSVVAALIVALLIGYLVARYHSAMRRRIQELYDASIRDGLTGLLNSRGAADAINKSLTRHPARNATLLVDIDNLKMVNYTRGHVTGDAVIARTAEAIRESIREGDECARVGGDEFIIFAPDCDAGGAAEIARRILDRLSKPVMPLAVTVGVSIGIALHDGSNTDFDRMYRDAGEALYQARIEGKSRVGVLTQTATTPFQPERSPAIA